jgi:4-amino-4-deoxy-L-arabinose transferase-like glycosyltransferase
VKPHTPTFRSTAFAAILCIFFFCAGLAFIPHVGIEADEALFAQGVYRPRGDIYSIHIGRSNVPIMLMSYLGALKSIVYGPVLRNLGVGLHTLRIPMLLAGTISVWLFFLLLRRVAGERAALIGCVLLACDPMYLLTSCFDWGPVALQHLLTIGGALALIYFFQERRDGALAAAAFLFGLALWDKALAVWIISGLGIAGILTFPRQIFAALSGRRVCIAVLAFCAGALPLILYNANNHWETFNGNFQRDIASVPRKAAFLVHSATGSGLFNWLTADDYQTPHPHEPTALLEKASARISAVAGHPRNALLLYGFILSLLLAPFAGRKALRLIAFGLAAMGIAWIQMAINRETGGSIHHTILLWPIPQFIIAISFSGACDRLGRAAIPALAAIVAILGICGALVTNEYFATLVRNGSGPVWSDAIFPLSRYLKDSPDRWVFAMDWNIAEPLHLLHRGKVLVGAGFEQISKPEMTPADRVLANQMFTNPENLFISHTPAFETFHGYTQKLAEYGTAIGYRRQTLTTIADSHGRNVYEVYRYTK